MKNVIFHDLFKLLLGGPRWYCKYVEMFLAPLEGILSLRIHFWFVLGRPEVRTFSTQILTVGQCWPTVGLL